MFVVFIKLIIIVFVELQMLFRHISSGAFGPFRYGMGLVNCIIFWMTRIPLNINQPFLTVANSSASEAW